jgi:tRNA threonylcarbamoyladenosine biosynthesis protein TsaB
VSEVRAIQNPLILAIDTSQPALGLAVAEAGAVLASVIDTSGLPHSQRLFPLIAVTLEKLGQSIAAIDLFVVNTGPGSFTGLRIGIAAVKGLAATLEKPLLGINAIDAVAFAAKVISVPIIVMLNASRGEVFCGLRIAQENDALQRIGQDRVAPISLLEPDLEARLGSAEAVLIGSGASSHW